MGDDFKHQQCTFDLFKAMAEWCSDEQKKQMTQPDVFTSNRSTIFFEATYRHEQEID